MKIIAQNKKAFFEYDIEYRIEAGLSLTGDEVKSAKSGSVNLTGSFATTKGNELYLINAHIAGYSKAFLPSEEETRRSRKLLLHRREINKLLADVARKGVTIIPLKMYVTKRGMIKLELGVGKHKKATGKKQALKERDIARETERSLKNYTS